MATGKLEGVFGTACRASRAGTPTSAASGGMPDIQQPSPQALYQQRRRASLPNLHPPDLRRSAAKASPLSPLSPMSPFFGSQYGRVSAVDSVKAAVTHAQRAGVSGRRVSEVEHMLEQEELLKQATEAGDLKRLWSAIRKAQVAGVSKKVIDTAKSHFIQQEAYELMQHAIEQADYDGLRSAISKAKAANIAKNDITAAEGLLQQLESRERLRAALDTKKPEAIRWAIKQSKEEGLDKALIKQAQEFLLSLESRRNTHNAPSHEPELVNPLAKGKKAAAPQRRHSVAHLPEASPARMDRRCSLPS